MLKTYLYVPEFLNKQIQELALIQKTSKAEVIRKAIEKGINIVQQQSSASVQALFKLAQLGEKIKPRGPKDLSSNLDKYLWGIDKNE